MSPNTCEPLDIRYVGVKGGNLDIPRAACSA